MFGSVDAHAHNDVSHKLVTLGLWEVMISIPEGDALKKFSVFILRLSRGVCVLVHSDPPIVLSIMCVYLMRGCTFKIGIVTFDLRKR